ncbi:MAG TPA: hypothetical protein VFP19_08120, partial [Candidatus Limnocylindrales bacterium]|nr:hypothetical protein [Candidatus Limnocylindrales bacterium]
MARAAPDGEPRPASASEALIAVAIDAAGAGGARAFTYGVPEQLGTLAPGEAVLVEFGRRQALGLVLGPATAEPGLAIKPVLARVRADGPLLPPLAIRLAGWISSHYLAPPALTLRAMLPPGLLERFELVAELRPGADAGASADDAVDRRLLESLGDGPRVVRRLDAPEGRPALLRRLRRLQEAGRIDLDWTLLDASAGPRYVRMVRL